MSSGGLLTVQLQRDGQNTAWGFRLMGGADLGYPLTIQRVCVGSPSEGELRKGDIILRIANNEGQKLTHQQANNLIRNAGNTLTFVVHRTTGPTSPDPMTPTWTQSQNPLANTSRPFSPAGGGSISPAFKALPVTQFNGPQMRYLSSPTPPTYAPVQSGHSNYSEYVEREMERQQIVSQPHRTFPLIQPSLKTKKDLPTGSYLRHVQDPFIRASPSVRPNEALMKARVQESVMRAVDTRSASPSMYGGSAGVSPRGSTPDVGLGLPLNQNQQLVHKQYNSPLALYSTQNVASSIHGQTGVKPDFGMLQNAIVDYAEKTQIEALIPSTTNGVARPFDITMSPTYQQIQEQEWAHSRECNPVQNKVKCIRQSPQEAQVFGGHPRDRVTQSKSFGYLMNTLTGESDF